jgi:pimeloyl-ACP methyl ester carboxylesterase
MHKVFSSTFFNFEFLRVLSTAPHRGCEIGEALDAASRIRDSDPESWSREWVSCSARAETLADEAAAAGDVGSACAAYLRAANYARASQYMLSDRPGAPDKRVLPRAERCAALFRKGVKLVDEAEVRCVEISYEGGISFPGILYLPRTQNRVPGGNVPVVVNVNGGDSIQEELFFICPSAGPRLGYAVLTFDGPGQGMVLRREGVGMRPDYEVATGRVLDWLWRYADAHPGLNLDLQKVAVVGASMGGYYALRAAADERFTACVSVDPAYDMWDLATSKMPGWFISGWLGGWISDGIVNGMVGMLSSTNFQFKWEVGHMMWAFGQDSPAKALRGLRDYTLRLTDGGEYLHKVKCAVMVTGAAASLYFQPELSTMKIYDELIQLDEHKKKCWIAKDVGSGGLQAKIGAFGVSNLRTFAFLDEQFGIRREALKL